jgi:hypothetical protein
LGRHRVDREQIGATVAIVTLKWFEPQNAPNRCSDAYCRALSSIIFPTGSCTAGHYGFAEFRREKWLQNFERFGDLVPFRSRKQWIAQNTTLPISKHLIDFLDGLVLRSTEPPGAQGTLGHPIRRNTSGGAVIIVPQRPTDALEGYVEGSLGNYELRCIQAVVNVPVADTLRVRLGLDRQTREGLIKNVSGIGPGDLKNITTGPVASASSRTSLATPSSRVLIRAMHATWIAAALNPTNSRKTSSECKSAR